MKNAKLKNLSRVIIYLTFCLSYLQIGYGQQILYYGSDSRTAAVHYNGFLFGIYENVYKKQPEYPVKGAYSPTHYANSFKGIPTGAGACNYIYIPTKGVLLPGHQYKISLTVNLSEAYNQLPYFQAHFGVALTSDLFENYFGLWSKHYVPLNIQITKELITKEFFFRPLCTSEYLVLGVFQGADMETKDCFACQYGFELNDLTVEVWNDPKAAYVYICDAFEEERMEKKFSSGYDTDTVYFDRNSSEIQEKYFRILDSVQSKLRTKQDLINLYAYTDIEGSDNDSLGAARNASVREALIARGIDTARILMINYGESRASGSIKQEDRRVEIVINQGKLFQKFYTESLQAMSREEYGLANEKKNNWLKLVPPDIAIYAIFDCWGEGEKASLFKEDLMKSIRSKYYKGNDLKFTLDSLYCEDQKGRTLSMYLRMNRLPGTHDVCSYNLDSISDLSNRTIVDKIYTEYGFPTVAEVGERGNQVLPYLILHARDTTFQNLYLPIVQKACEDQLIRWDYYAMLYDKISIVRSGRQRYGTQWLIDINGILGGLCPFEDTEMVAEYRKQVGLAPLNDY
jgi:hypothetical protein